MKSGFVEVTQGKILHLWYAQISISRYATTISSLSQQASSSVARLDQAVNRREASCGDGDSLSVFR